MGSESEPYSLPNGDLRGACSVVNLLTSLKRRTNSRPPTALLIQRKFSVLSQSNFDTLSLLVENKISMVHGPLSPHHVGGMTRALKCFQTDTAAEIAHVHACGVVVSASAVKAALFESSHMVRIGLQHLAAAQRRGIPLHPIATDLHARAMATLSEGEGGDEKTPLEIMGVGDSRALKDGTFESSTGLLIGAALCILVMSNSSVGVCCGSCRRVVSGYEISICSRCGDHLACQRCLTGEGYARHMNECRRVRTMVRAMAESLMPLVRHSARRVAVVRLNGSGLIVPVHTTSIASPLIPSSLWESLSRCPTVVPHSAISTHWRLLVAFLAQDEGDDQEAIEYEHVYHVQAAKHAVVADGLSAGPAHRAPALLPSEQRRLRKGRRAAENRTAESVRAAAEAQAQAQANEVLERQAARPDATSAMLTSVLSKRESTASPEVIARVRVKRDSLKVAERRERKPPKTRPGWSPARAVHNENVSQPSDRSAAALLLQRHVRAWLRWRKKARRRQRSCAAKLLQRSIRTWLLPRVATTASPGSNEDDEDRLLCVVCLERSRVMLFLVCAHLCACESCAAQLTECPLCRAVSVTMRVFI